MMSISAAKSKKSRSLVAMLITAFLVLSLIIALITNLSLFVIIGRSIQADINSQQKLVAREAASAVVSFVNEKFSNLEAVAEIGNPTFASQEEQGIILSNLLGLDHAFRQLVLLDAQGRELAKLSRISQAAADEFVGRIDKELLTQIKQDNRYISSIYIDELTSEPIVIMAVPIIDALGDFQGTLLAEVNLKFMWDLVDRLEVGETGYAYVVDEQGNLIASGDIGRVLRGENVSQLSLIDGFISNPVSPGEATTNLFQGINTTPVVGTYVPLGTPGWAVVTELPVMEALRPAIISSVISVSIMLGIMVLAGLLAIYVARRLAAPLLNLTKTATQIAGGENNLEATVEGPTEIAQLAGAFNSMTAQLHELIDSLEERVADRTQRLELLATLSERLSAILDFEQLLTELVNQVKDRFGYYHAHVYILNEDRQDLVMAAGAGRAGAEMKAREHHIPLNAATSLVARAARTSRIVWVDNVREAEDWLPNPFLPNTYSEMAVPIMLQGQVVGVLDVQEDEIAGLHEGDASLLRSLANQVAVAIRNARLFAEVESALADAAAAQEQYMGQTWEKIKTGRHGAEYQYHRVGTATLDKAILAQLEQEAATQDRVTVVALGNGSKPGQMKPNTDDESDGIQDPVSEIQEQTALVTPIRLQNQTIGMINLVETEGQRQWSELELTLVQVVADQLAQTAENLRLFEETRQRASREQTIREITDKLRVAPNLDILLETAARELGLRLGARHTVLEMGIETDTNRLDRHGPAKTGQQE
jgi:GAF domain-containing protein/HAMP domain-containing protein